MKNEYFFGDEEQDDEDDFPDVNWTASTYRSKEIRTRRFKENRRKEVEDTAKEKKEDGKSPILPWSPHLAALLCGVKQEEKGCPLRMLRGREQELLKPIYDLGCVDHWKQNVRICPPAHDVSFAVVIFAEDEENCAKMTDFDRGVHSIRSSFVGQEEEHRPEVAFSLVGTVPKWPKPTGRNVNMLPFIMGEKSSLPADLRPYYDLCELCPVDEDEFGKVLYLTVHEAPVDADKTQRRAGLHVEAADIAGVGGDFWAGTESNWGGGVGFVGDEASPDRFEGGLYMASNVDDTCMLWDALVAKGQGVTDFHGGGEHLRSLIGGGTALKANEIAWLTDRTPHEALPQKKSGHRQFFRLVTSNVTFWFKEHSTPNPKCPLPDSVRIVEGSKFRGGGPIIAARCSSGVASRPVEDEGGDFPESDRPAKKIKQDSIGAEIDS